MLGAALRAAPSRPWPTPTRPLPMPISRSRAPISARSDVDQELAGRDQAISDREQAAADRRARCRGQPDARRGSGRTRNAKAARATHLRGASKEPNRPIAHLYATATPPQVSATVPRTNAMTEGSSEMPTIAADPCGRDGWSDPPNAVARPWRPRSERPHGRSLPGVGECIAAALSTRQPWRPRSSYLQIVYELVLALRQRQGT